MPAQFVNGGFEDSEDLETTWTCFMGLRMTQALWWDGDEWVAVPVKEGSYCYATVGVT
jgi:hypothetical protein